MSISFTFTTNEIPGICYSECRYPKVIEWEGCFKIVVDACTFFEEPYFPILEFLRALENWDERNNFQYNAIETDMNPLISFEKVGNQWRLLSPWGKKNSTELISTTELRLAISELTDTVKTYF